MIKFTKMHANGNDFIIIDNINGDNSDAYRYIKNMCNRNLGIGADGVVIFKHNDDGFTDFIWDFYNSDGSIANMCGNASRCFVKYIFDNNLASSSKVSFKTLAGNIYGTYENNIPEIMLSQYKDLKELSINVFGDFATTLGNIVGLGQSLYYVDTGVPHLVVPVVNIDDIDVNYYGRLIRFHKYFSIDGTNVNFVKILDNGYIRVRTYERGVEAQTNSCGTGMAAVALIAKKFWEFSDSIYISTNIGDIVTVKVLGDELYLSGNVEKVFDGYYYQR